MCRHYSSPFSILSITSDEYLTPALSLSKKIIFLSSPSSLLTTKCPKYSTSSWSLNAPDTIVFVVTISLGDTNVSTHLPSPSVTYG